MRRAFFVALAVASAVPVSRDAAQAWNRSQPVSNRLSPGSDPLNRFRWLESRYATVDGIRTNSAEIRRASRRVLADDPLNAGAIRQLGILASLEQEDGAGNEFSLAERITRRDLPTQFALIDHAALADDLAGTLVHYDRALLVHPGAGGNLFPLLARAIPDAGIRAALRPYAGRKWFADFLKSADGMNADPLSLVALYVDLRGKLSAEVVQPAVSRLLGQLIDTGDYTAVRDLLRTVPHVGPEAFDTIGFSAATTDPRIVPLSWVIRNDETVEAEASEGTLLVRVAPERSALVAERTTILAPGRYALVQEVRYETDAPPAQLEWSVTCAGSPGSTILAPGTAPVASHAKQVSHIVVPDGCKAQKWQLRATAGMSQAPSTARIANLTLVKE